MPRSLLQISEIARLLGVTPKTIRHYHKRGLLPEPERSESSYRLYSADDLAALQRVRRLQSLGLSLQQIKFILDSDDPDHLLRETLRNIHREIVRQRQSLAERQERIESFLAEQGTLQTLAQPPDHSPTADMLQAMIGELAAQFPPALLNAEKMVFAHLDSFHWPAEYADYWQQTAEFLLTHRDELFGFLQILGAKLLALADLPAEDPQIEQWAAEMRASEAFTLPGISFLPTPPATPVSSVFQQVLLSAFEVGYTPAQRRFLELVLLPQSGKE